MRLLYNTIFTFVTLCFCKARSFDCNKFSKFTINGSISSVEITQSTQLLEIMEFIAQRITSLFLPVKFLLWT